MEKASACGWLMCRRSNRETRGSLGSAKTADRCSSVCTHGPSGRVKIRSRHQYRISGVANVRHTDVLLISLEKQVCVPCRSKSSPRYHHLPCQSLTAVAKQPSCFLQSCYSQGPFRKRCLNDLSACRSGHVIPPAYNRQWLLGHKIKSTLPRAVCKALHDLAPFWPSTLSRVTFPLAQVYQIPGAFSVPQLC